MAVCPPSLERRLYGVVSVCETRTPVSLLASVVIDKLKERDLPGLGIEATKQVVLYFMSLIGWRIIWKFYIREEYRWALPVFYRMRGKPIAQVFGFPNVE